MNTDDKNLQMNDELLESVNGGDKRMGVPMDIVADAPPATPDLDLNPYTSVPMF
jgi:hypothetical protein